MIAGPLIAIALIVILYACLPWQEASVYTTLLVVFGWLAYHYSHRKPSYHNPPEGRGEADLPPAPPETYSGAQAQPTCEPVQIPICPRGLPEPKKELPEGGYEWIPLGRGIEVGRKEERKP